MNDTQQEVRIWRESITIPTYGVGQPNKNPMFLEKRVYQGSSGAVYPHAVIDKIHDEKSDQSYEAVFLENRWLKIMILPELGGRVQMALDKTNDYHFVYYNRVIKPALVGLAGPWVSGGIEFNWPQHHRPSTFEPMQWRIVDNDDGSKTLWCSEIERMFGTKGMHGFTIHPDKAYLEINVQLYNRTATPQTFLWWANPAVAVNDDYQSVFPQDVHAVMDHGKRDASDFPIATGTYYKMDYSPGTDISRYKNIPVPTSFMAYHSDYNFLGCYDHGPQAGLLHVANHHIAPGKKQWTWGKGDFGEAWDRQLTDEDGPYIELMCGCYTDNQPDFTWLMPYEQKTFTQYFMPYKKIGPVKNATIRAAVNLEVQGDQAKLGVYVTSTQKQLKIILQSEQSVCYETVVDLSPESAFVETVTVPQAMSSHELTLVVSDCNGCELVSFTPIKKQRDDIPEPAKAALPPAEVATVEQLYLTGLHLEQYRHATFEPQHYYKEALRRDPTDVRNNNALGLWQYRRGRFVEAESLFNKAIETITQRNPNPYDGEPYYNLGLALKMQGRFDEAFDAFYKSVWNAAWQDAGYFELAKIACQRGDYEQALELVERSLVRNWHNHKARHLKTAILRTLQRNDAAQVEIKLTEQLDKLDFGSLYEQALLADSKEKESLLDQLDQRMGSNVHNTIEIALDYADAWLWHEAIELLKRCDSNDPMHAYYLAYFTLQSGDENEAKRLYERASTMTPGCCFPNRLACIAALKSAMQLNPTDGLAPHHLGNYLFARRDHDKAIALWEQARKLNPSFATVHRNLGLAYFNKRGDANAALASLEKAFELDTTDARVFLELDQLYRRLNYNIKHRLAKMDQQAGLVAQRDDLMIERITLANLAGQHEQALEMLMGHQFHPWEGGEGKVIGQYVFALVQLARQAIDESQYPKAIDYLKRAQVYPPTLGEGKLIGAKENQIHYYLGVAYELVGEIDQAKQCWVKASVGLDKPGAAMYYNDQPPDTIYYQGLALKKLVKPNEAKVRFDTLIEFGQSHLHDEPTIDYFAVSLPDFLVFEEDLTIRNQIHCLYMMALGHLGLGQNDQAKTCLDQVLSLDVSHLGTGVGIANS